MKKVTESISVILKGILFIGFSIQIVLGIIWMCFNFVHLQEFDITDGFLYRGLRSLAGSYFWILYVMQLALAFYAGRSMLQSLCRLKGFWNIWCSLALLTFPMAMQCHMALSPYSFTGSLFLMELGFSVRAVREKEGAVFVALAKVCGCWFLLAVLLPEYLLLGAIPPILAFLFCLSAWKKQPRRMVYSLLLLAAFGGIVAGTRTLGDVGESPFSRENAVFSLFSRMVWPTVWNDTRLWPEEVLDLVQDEIRNVSYKAENMERILRPLVEEGLGQEQATQYFLQMAKASWTVHGSMIVRQIGWDALGYSVTPLILPLQLKGEAYDSYSGRNYELMLSQAPVLTGYYMKYGCWWFGVMLALAAILTVVRAVGGMSKSEKGGRRFEGKPVLLCILAAGVVTAAYTMRGAGMMDYKCTIAVNLLWITWAMKCERQKETPGL